MMTVLEGVVMELQDCALPLLREVIPTDKEEVAFKDLDIAILVGSMPRREGMERKDLLKANVKIFKSQGAALDKYAKKTVKVNIGTEFKTLILYYGEIWIHCRRILHKQEPVQYQHSFYFALENRPQSRVDKKQNIK
ncbi:hypothetical protein Nmel_003681 [Mimus melanotis]